MGNFLKRLKGSKTVIGLALLQAAQYVPPGGNAQLALMILGGIFGGTGILDKLKNVVLGENAATGKPVDRP